MGSKLGWIAAGTLVVGLLVVIIMKVVIPSPSRPSLATRKEGFMDLKKVSIPVGDIIGAKPGGAGNAADDYIQALAVARHRAHEQAPVAGRESTPTRMAALRKIASLVAAGADKATAEYTFTHTPRTFEVGYRFKPAVGLQAVPGAMFILARELHESKKYAQAETVLFNMFVMGWHLSEERANLYVVRTGFGIQMDALGGLQSVYRDWGPEHGEKMARVAAYMNEIITIQRDFSEKQRILWSTDPKPGDVFHIIEKDQDRTWRVQAILSLGIVKFRHEDRRGDMRQMNKLLERFSSSSDPFEAAAAKAVKNLTREEFRSLGTKF